MIQSASRLWKVCLFGISAFFFYNILITFLQLYAQECPRSHPQAQPNQPPPAPPVVSCVQAEEVESSLPTLDVRLGRWDSKRLYKMFDNVIVGERFLDLSEEYMTCLATQSSLEKLSSLIEVVKHWSGPISAAIFAAGDEELEYLLTYVSQLRRCYPRIKENVIFHLALPKDHLPSNTNLLLEVQGEVDCSQLEVTLQAMVKKIRSMRWRTRLAYPQNHLRNLARKNCQSKFVFLTDVDIIPSVNLAEELDTFLRKQECKGLCAYVVPTYEIDSRVPFPPNKSELVRLANKGLARPFHHKVFIYNQFATNFTRWQSGGQESQEVYISHPVTNFEFLYEPFYVAPDTVPQHDERFIGYGYTRNTQVYEMFVAGYQFLVLSPAFTCHWGLQVKRSRPAWREHQNSQNRRQFETFKQEVFARYNKDPLNLIKPKT